MEGRLAEHELTTGALLQLLGMNIDMSAQASVVHGRSAEEESRYSLLGIATQSNGCDLALRVVMCLMVLVSK